MLLSKSKPYQFKFSFTGGHFWPAIDSVLESKCSEFQSLRFMDQKYFGSNENLNRNKSLDQKNFGSEKFCEQKKMLTHKFGVKKDLGPRNYSILQKKGV